MQAQGHFVQPSATGFCIGAEELPWGITHAELREALKARGLLHASESDSFLRGYCPQAYGFPTISFEAGATPENRPVSVLTYHLAPYDPQRAVADPRFWAEPLRAVLGEPELVSESDEAERETAGEGTVLYYANWRQGTLGVGLSVFGGQRPEVAGIAAAYLYLSWNDLQASARPYLPQWLGGEARLAAAAAAGVEMQTLTLAYELNPNYPGGDMNERQCQRALAADAQYDTPLAWRNRLDAKQVALWTSRDGALWGVSSHWDTVCYARTEAVPRVEWVNFLPSRFGGYMELQLAGLRLLDVHNSSALRTVAEFIGRCQGRPLECAESKDNG
jgi:hypothetical protein